MMDGAAAAAAKNVAFRFMQGIIWTAGNSASWRDAATKTCARNIAAKWLHNDIATERSGCEGGIAGM
jgi:hypothetical protein